MKTALSFVLLTILQRTSAQLLTTGTSQLPACALGCTLLNQAVNACGGQTSSTQAEWICFCQSGYLTTLYTTPSGVCDAFCTDPTQNQLVMTWYTSNCGTDHGASEHPDTGAAPAVSSAAAIVSSATTSATTSATSAGASTGSTGGAHLSDQAPGTIDTTQQGSWWSNHYKWIIMVIVLLAGIIALAVTLIYLKRRHDRRQDTVTGGFNEGITMRSTPMATVANPAPIQPSSGRDSPVRTRDAFMPYGYGYSRSESRLGSRTDLGDSQVRASPLSHGITPADMDKSAVDSGTPTAGKKKRVFVSERSMTADSNTEH